MNFLLINFKMGKKSGAFTDAQGDKRKPAIKWELKRGGCGKYFLTDKLFGSPD